MALWCWYRTRLSCWRRPNARHYGGGTLLGYGKTDNIAVDLSKYVIYGVTHASLSSQIDHPLCIAC